MLTIVLGVTVIGPASLAYMVWWVYGNAGYTSGIRVHFVGKTPWFSNGERVPDAPATAGAVGAFVASIVVSYLIMYCVRHIYRVVRKQNRAQA